MDEAKELIKAVEHLDSDLKLWVAQKYHLLSAGKPPELAPTWKIPPTHWDKNDLEFATAWDNWKKKCIENASSQCDAFTEQFAIWMHGAKEKGVNISTVEVGAEEPKPDKYAFLKKAALIGGGAFAAWYLFFREKEKPEIIEPMPIGIQIPRRVDVAQTSFVDPYEDIY